MTDLTSLTFPTMDNSDAFQATSLPLILLAFGSKYAALGFP